ncbi:hypothetical protein [Desulfosporosinus sp. SB140]|uniref:hypothetical protein n=1 Tax=Desulfosporosinus paludis TaxID=3115649 RepID=UPI00388DDDD4
MRGSRHKRRPWRYGGSEHPCSLPVSPYVLGLGRETFSFALKIVEFSFGDEGFG